MDAFESLGGSLNAFSILVSTLSTQIVMASSS
jgi:hypothetical protein